MPKRKSLTDLYGRDVWRWSRLPKEDCRIPVSSHPSYALTQSRKSLILTLLLPPIGSPSF